MPGDAVELVIKLRDDVRPGSPDASSVRTTLKGAGVDLGPEPTGSGTALDSYRSVIVPRDVASRAVEALKGEAAVDGAFVKERGETP